MTAYETLQSEVAYSWRNLHGRAGVYIQRPVSPIGCIIYLLKLFYQSDSNKKVGIIVKDTQLSSEIRNNVFNYFKGYRIDVMYHGYVKDIMFLNYDLLITVNVTDINKLKTVVHSKNFKFYLCIFDNRTIGKETTEREALMPIVQVRTPTHKIIEDYVLSPVKETQCAVTLTEEDYLNYKQYDDYVKESIRIFQNLETLDRCRQGDRTMNQTALEVCEVVASNNGWSYDVDTTTEIGIEIDKMFNPIGLKDRACQTYNNIRERKSIVVNDKSKLQKIAEIVDNNKDKKILIISVKGTFAHDISEYLNNMYSIEDTDEYIKISGEYHNEIPECVYKDRKGNVVNYKSGEKAGQPKIIGHKKQSTLANKDFNDGYINVLCIKGTSDIDLVVDCDIVIFTSPFVGTIYDIKRRFKNVLFKSNPCEIYTLYNIGTIEEKEINKRTQSPTYEIIKDGINIFVND